MYIYIYTYANMYIYIHIYIRYIYIYMLENYVYLTYVSAMLAPAVHFLAFRRWIGLHGGCHELQILTLCE